MELEKPSALTPINNPKHRKIPEERRCRGHKKTGERCQRPAMLGGTVCRHHGGAAPHVKRAAQARLENAADRMARMLLGIATDDDSPPAVRLAAIRDALDRAGLSARAALDVTVEMPRYEKLLAAMDRSAIPIGEGATAPDIVDGEIVGETLFDDGREP